MNKHINFEDNLFLLNGRIRLIRDLLRLDGDPSLFLGKTLDDLRFIDTVLETLTHNLIENTRLFDRELEFDHLSDVEWQHGQLLLEFAGEAGPFPASRFPEIREELARLRERSDGRSVAVATSAGPAEQVSSEPVVSSLELSELLREF